MTLLIYIRTTLSSARTAVLLLSRNTGGLVHWEMWGAGVQAYHISLDLEGFLFCVWAGGGAGNLHPPRKTEEKEGVLKWVEMGLECKGAVGLFRCLLQAVFQKVRTGRPIWLYNLPHHQLPFPGSVHLRASETPLRP